MLPFRRQRPMILAAAASCALAGLAVPVHGAGDVLSAMLIDETLTPRKVTITGFDGDEVVFLDQQGSERRISRRRLMALVSIDAGADVREGLGVAVRRPVDDASAGVEAPLSSSGMLRMVDGQHFPGEVEASPSVDELVHWRHQRFGDMRISMDLVGVLARRGWTGWSQIAAASDDLPSEDELYLLNGDVLQGFLVGLTDPVQFETDDLIELPAERVAAVRLSNTPKAISGMVVWLSDGTVAAVENIASRHDRNLVLTLAKGQSGVYEVSELRGLAFDADRIRPLSSIAPDDQLPVGDRLYLEEMRTVPHPDARRGGADALNSRDLLFPGPMSVTWTLPAGCERFAGTASLVYGSAPWGDCELVIEVDGREIFRARLNEEVASTPFNVDVDGSELKVTVDPGVYGPIHDRVILQRPTLLLGRGDS